ncbi:NUDIX domain-containing protein [Halosegnis marinus]|uniref:NUDIX domain-containing protein n=1 Tax=Halosegnis marinus TaxID=3034023 RepID=UPI00361EB6CE
MVRAGERTEVPPARWEHGRDREGTWGVGALVEHDGRVLMVEQGDAWLLPGGMLEPGETHAEGATREVREETGVRIDTADLLAVTERTFVNAADGREFDFRFATFRGVADDTETSDDPGIDDEGITAVAWHGALPENTFDRDLVARLRGRRL